MIILFAIVGAAIGLVAEPKLVGVLLGGVVGALLGLIADLRERVQSLEGSREARGRSDAAAPRAPADPLVPAASPAAATVEPHRRPPPEPPRAPTPRPTPETRESRPDPLERALALGKRWLTTGNVPVKLGVVVSLFGVAFLIKEAVDRELLRFSPQMRLVSVAVFGLGLLAVGWRLRQRQRVYALSIQGGGVALLYLTIYAAFALYQFIPAQLAFVLLVVLTLAAGVLAVAQNARALAVLGIVGGFLAPILTSTDSGNHVALFGYYVVLNAAVLGIAWFRQWRELSLLGFVFTFVIGSLWGYQAYQPAHFATTEPFLIVFFLMYVAIVVMYAWRGALQLTRWTDGPLVVGTPLVAFSLQSAMLEHTGLAGSAFVLAGFYALLSVGLRRRVPDARDLSFAFAAIAAAFLAIAIPLALDARWTAIAWALQSLALVWLGLRRRRLLALAGGVVLQIAAAISFADQPGLGSSATAVLNGETLTGLVIALTAGVIGWLFDRTRPPEVAIEASLAVVGASVALAWAGLWWFALGYGEIGRHAPARLFEAAALAFSAASATAFMWLAPRVRWPRLNWLTLVLLPAMGLAGLLAIAMGDPPSQHYGWLVWPLAFAAQYGFLRYRAAFLGRIAPAWHVATAWLLAALAAWEAYAQIERIAAGIWPAAATIALLAGLVFAGLHAPWRAHWPFAAHERTYLGMAVGGIVAFAGVWLLALNLTSPGDPAPVAYLPLANPLDVVSVAALWLGVRWWRAMRATFEAARAAGPRPVVLAVAGGFTIMTTSVVRTVHHWTGVPFRLDALASSDTVQAALSIVWAVSAFSAMLIGARRARRTLWIAGAALMGIVVGKLFLVELDNSGTIARIVSFIGVGALLLVIGYFAPAPPRETSAQ